MPILDREIELNKLILPLLEQVCCLLDNVANHDTPQWKAASDLFKEQLKDAAKQAINLKSPT